MATITISLPDNLREYVERRVADGGYGNVSEFFRSLVREDAKQYQERLEKLLLEGLQTEAMDATPQFWEELRAEAKARVEEARKRHGKKKSA